MEVIANPKSTVLHAESTSFNSGVTPFRRTSFISVMPPAKSECFSVIVTAFGRAGHFNVVVTTNTSSPAVVVSDARILCADPVCAMFGADKLAKNLRSVAAWSSAG